MLLKGSNLSDSNNNSSTQELSAADIRIYFPYMDTKIALKYNDAILKGQYKFKVEKGLVEQWNRNRLLKNSGVMQEDNLVAPSSEYVKLTWWKLQQYLPIMDSKTSSDYLAEHLLDESKWITVKATIMEEWEKKLAVYKDDENSLQLTASNNNKGIAFEKQGDTASAIEVYEKNLEIGYPASHSYNRLMIIYHREKRYEDEVRVIKKAIEVFSSDVRYNKDVTKWQERLNKLTNK